MLDLTTCDQQLLELVDLVCSRLLKRSDHLQPADLMILGAHCRNLLHDALGHKFTLRATEDVDLAFAIADWEAYAQVVKGLSKSGDTGIRYNVADIPTDLVPFGPIEEPTGVVPDPPHRDLSVWAFQEVFNSAHELPLPTAGSIKIPTVPGYTALKLAAWLDRSENDNYKDAPDIATALFWYTNSGHVSDRLYTDVVHGFETLDKFDMDETQAAAYLLGEDLATEVGTERIAELDRRWPGPRNDDLPRLMNIATNPLEWSPNLDRRNALLNSMQLGWSTAL
ncbi:hypothetical protein [Rhodococcus opacus]|uniref:hypothetical protein n=1 Tax=Rhodococcus opacus TaxID=37919 RepID=UPI0029535924|nr:hypothetical protein [Rhodococcus opacus]MDV7090233.1 hypothetical protein [Rhodococcus opacus]